MMNEELAEGLDEPIIEKDQYCFFDKGDYVVLMKQWDGEILSIPKEVFMNIVPNLEKEGWKTPEY
jgi:hypothetical protein